MILPRKPLFLVISLGAIITAVLLGVYGKNWFHEVPDRRLATPAPLLQEILQSSPSVFVTPEFLPCTSSWSANQKSRLPSAAVSEAASRDKTLFWRLNREKHFSAVLVGNSPAWRSLAVSLLNSPLWVLSNVSPWGYLFRPRNPEVAEWKISSEKELEADWPRINDRARFMILTAANLAAINRLPEAEQLLEMASSTHRLPSLILSTRASLAAVQGRWDDAVKLAKESLSSDHKNRAARETLIRGLIESGHTDEALSTARELIEQAGEDESSLFLLARAASAANSGKEETDALMRLVTVGRRDRQPLGASLTYLGQAYAKQGNRGDALRTFQEASLAPELSDEQRRMIRDIMDHLMEGNTSSSSLPALKSSSVTNP